MVRSNGLIGKTIINCYYQLLPINNNSDWVVTLKKIEQESAMGGFEGFGC